MELHESARLETLTRSDYEIERNKPMPSLNHSAIQSNLIMELAPYRDRFRIASELSLELANWPSVPDICLYPKHPLDLKNDRITVREPPLCAIEIISPSQSVDEMRAKAEKYFEHGVQSCWIVLPAFANIYVFSNPDAYEIFRSSETLWDNTLGVSLPLQGVFE
jgi:Uma2 family endonuclease